MQTSLKSLLAFVYSDVKNAFSQSPQYICVHQHGDRDTDVSGKSTEIYGAARGLPDFKMVATVLSWPNLRFTTYYKDALDDFQEVADTDRQAASWGEREVQQL